MSNQKGQDTWDVQERHVRQFATQNKEVIILGRGKPGHIPASAMLGSIDTSTLKCTRGHHRIQEFKSAITEYTKTSVIEWKRSMNTLLHERRKHRKKAELEIQEDTPNGQDAQPTSAFPNGIRAESWHRADAERVNIYHSAYTESQSEMGGRSSSKTEEEATYWSEHKVTRVEHVLDPTGRKLINEDELTTRYPNASPRMITSLLTAIKSLPRQLIRAIQLTAKIKRRHTDEWYTQKCTKQVVQITNRQPSITTAQVYAEQADNDTLTKTKDVINIKDTDNTWTRCKVVKRVRISTGTSDTTPSHNNNNN